jgi:hypothetical protein
LVLSSKSNSKNLVNNSTVDKQANKSITTVNKIGLKTSQTAISNKIQEENEVKNLK